MFLELGGQNTNEIHLVAPTGHVSFVLWNFAGLYGPPSAATTPIWSIPRG